MGGECLAATASSGHCFEQLQAVNRVAVSKCVLGLKKHSRLDASRTIRAPMLDATNRADTFDFIQLPRRLNL